MSVLRPPPASCAAFMRAAARARGSYWNSGPACVRACVREEQPPNFDPAVSAPQPDTIPGNGAESALTAPRGRGARRPPAACPSALRCAVAGLRR